MKRLYSLLTALLLTATMFAQPVRVISNTKLGEGFLPRISADGTEVTYLTHHTDAYPEQTSDLYVTNEDLHLYLYRNGQRTELLPHGENYYICASLSPDKTMVLFRSRKGTGVCDLSGRLLYDLGEVVGPEWYGNDHVVGFRSEQDGHEYTSSKIILSTLAGEVTDLTDGSTIDMCPHASAASGRVVFNSLDGSIRMLQLNLTDQPIRRDLPILRAEQAPVKAQARRTRKQNFSDIKIYINPGHGGYTGNDRGMTIYPFHAGDTLGFWESSSNLHKGLKLDTMLRSLGVKTMLSRTLNRELDDKNLYDIVCEANAYNADFMLSIHSNAGGPSNYILQLYSGKDADDPVVYADYGTRDAESRAISTIIGNNLHKSNVVSDWTRVPYIVGDKTFARKIMGWSNGYGVLRYLRVPGEISEGGMHDYIPQTYRLMNMDYKKAEAYQFMQAFLTYFLEYTPATGVIGGQVRDSYQKMIFPAINTHKNGSADALKPLCGAMVELLQNGSVIRTYTTDTLYNGVFYFWDLMPGTYTVRANMDGYYSAEQQMTVVPGDIVYHNFLLNMQRQTPPVVTSHSPNPASITDSVLVSSTIYLTFNWDMNTEETEAAFSISPAVEGTITFENGARAMRFTPDGRFAPGVEYTVTLSTRACHPDTSFPNHLEQPYVFSFRTQDRGSIRFLNSYPADGELDVPLNPSFISVYDQSIVSSTVKNAVTLTDAAGNAVAINARSIKCNVAPAPYGTVAFETTGALQPSTDYVLTLGGSIKDNLGIFLNDPHVIHFTTAAAFSPDLELVDALDTLVFVADREKSMGYSAISTLRNTNKKYTGQASNELSYTFLADEAEAVYALKNPMLIQAKKGDRVGLYVFSDYSGNTLVAEWNCEGDIKYTPVCEFNYGGWKWQEMDLSELPDELTYQLMSLRVVRGTGVLTSKGSVYLNSLSYLAGPTAVENIESISTEVTKELRHTQFLIHRAGKTYTVLGQTLR